jgi:hypothetical protein
MGDRAYTAFYVHGRIETVEAFEELVDAIYAGDFHSERDFSLKSTEEDVRAEIIRALAGGESCASFCHEDCNYGNTEDLQEPCKKHGLSFQSSWEAGGDYEAGHVIYVHGEGQWSDHEAELGIADVEAILATPDPAAELCQRLDTMNKAAGKTLPPLSVSDVVRGYLAVDIARLRVAA